MKFKTVQTESNIYKLRFTYNSYCFIESVLGISMSELGNDFNPSFTDLRVFFQAALMGGEKRKFSIEEVGEILDEIIDEIGIEGMAGLLTDVISLSQSGKAYQTGK